MPLDREVAVKKPLPGSDADDPVFVLLQEALITGALQHPNIVPVYRLGRGEDGEPVIVMKRIEGVSWEEVLRDPAASPREFDTDKPLEWHLDILMDVCDALHYAHTRSIIHRDLKPENVMIGDFGEVYLVDWGLAVSVADDPPAQFPKAEEIVEPAGTPAYMAPEMAAGNGDRLSIQTDVYLLGALLYRLVTGSPPHDSGSLYGSMFHAYTSESTEYADELPGRLADICERAMAQDPEDRYDSALEFRRALVDYKQHRRASELTRQAETRQDDLYEALDGEEPDEAEVYEIFGECRFGYDEALEVDPEYDPARDGLQTVMERMVEWELDQGGIKAASLLLSELPESRPHLEERLERLREREADREQQFEQLKEFEREQDIELGRKARSLFCLALGIIMGTTSYVPWIVRTVVGFDLGFGDFFLQLAAVGAVLGGGLWLGRHDLFQNRANRQLVASFLWIFAGMFFFQKAVAKIQLNPVESIPFQMLSVAVAAGVVGTCIDRRVFWAAVPFFLGAYLASEFAAYAHTIDAMTDVTAMGLLALVWWPGKFKGLEDLIPDEVDEFTGKGSRR